MTAARTRDVRMSDGLEVTNHENMGRPGPRYNNVTNNVITNSRWTHCLSTRGSGSAGSRTFSVELWLDLGERDKRAMGPFGPRYNNVTNNVITNFRSTHIGLASRMCPAGRRTLWPRPGGDA